LLKRGDAQGALDAARAACESNARDASAHLAAGIALRLLGRLDESQKALERAAALDPLDYAALHELALVFEMKGDHDRALRAFERAAGLRPSFAASHFGVAHGRMRRGERSAAIAAFKKVLALEPRNVEAVRSYGMLLGRRGEFARSADVLARALELDPSHVDTALAQVHADLVAGNLPRGWTSYRHRAPRRTLEAHRLNAGRPYRIPAIDELQGHPVTLVGEQGLGDLLFFLRWAQPLSERTGPITFSGDARLHSILRRTALFASLAPADHPVPADGILVGDLPLVFPEIAYPPSLRVDPEPSRTAHWRARLEDFGPPPWIGVTWRAGDPSGVYFKTLPLERLFAALQSFDGTIVAIQRNPEREDLEKAASAVGRAVHDLSNANDDLEDALAVISLLDRYVGASNTNMHLAAIAGKVADVLLPFPPEWRWQLGETSPWFPGFRLYRQGVDGDWTSAFAALATSGKAGNTSRA
ncbi:MAG: tetratricopeptide repeat protein, partial [Bacillota bacterium]